MGWGTTGIDAGSLDTETGAQDLSSSLPRSAQLRSRFHISPQLQNSCLHFFRAGLVPRPRSVGLGWIAWACSPPAHFSLDSHFHPGQQRGQKGWRSLARKVRLESQQRAISCWRLGRRIALAAAAAAERAPGPARAPTAESRGDATLRAASPLLRYHADPHYPAGGQFAPAPGRAQARSRRSLGTGARKIRASGSREERAEESRSRAALHGEVSPFESSGVVSGF